jgi:hypothetical protein
MVSVVKRQPNIPHDISPPSSESNSTLAVSGAACWLGLLFYSEDGSDLAIQKIRLSPSHMALLPWRPYLLSPPTEPENPA